MYEDWITELQTSWASHRRDSPPDRLPHTETEALHGFLNGVGDLASAKIAATQITNYISGEEENVEDGIVRLWGYFFNGARQIPEAQDKLVELLSAIKKLPEPTRDGKSLDGDWSSGMKLWTDLPLFSWELRDLWNHFDPVPSDPEQARKRERWKNLNAFAARLTSAGVLDLSHYGEWELATALENAPWDEEWEVSEGGPHSQREKQLHRHSIQKLDGDLPAAAQWLIYAGDALKEKVATESGPPKENKRAGKLWIEAQGSSKSRWDFWRERFRWATDAAELQETTKEAARGAADKMGQGF